MLLDKRGSSTDAHDCLESLRLLSATDAERGCQLISSLGGRSWRPPFSTNKPAEKECCCWGETGDALKVLEDPEGEKLLCDVLREMKGCAGNGDSLPLCLEGILWRNSGGPPEEPGLGLGDERTGGAVEGVGEAG